MTDLQRFVPFQHGGSTLPGSVTPLQMAGVIRDFMAGFAPSSRITMRYALSRAAADLGMNTDTPIDNLPWHTLTASALTELIFQWQGSIETSTARLYIHAIRGVVRACFVRGLMTADQYVLFGEVKLPKGQNRVGRGRAVEARYKDALIKDCMMDERVQGVRDAALIALLFGSGIRRSEAASLLDENLDIDEGVLTVRVKGGDLAVRYIAAWSLPYLEAWRSVRRSHDIHRGVFFCRIWKGGKLKRPLKKEEQDPDTGPEAGSVVPVEMSRPQVKKGSQEDAPKGGEVTQLTGRGIFYLLEERSKRAGLPFLVRPHDARRTLGTEMLSEHGELIAQKVLGHADLSTTRIYDKRSDEAVKSIFRERK